MLDEYKGIKRSQSKDVFYWLDDYCQDQRPHILNNDIVLQSKVKKYHFKRLLKILLLNVSIWTSIVYAAFILTKG